MKNIKLVVRENLIKKITIQESLERISLEENTDKKMFMAVNHLAKLIDEGYDNEGIENHVNEQFDWLRNMFGGKGAGSGVNPMDSLSMDKMMGTAQTSGWRQFKQWMVRKFLGWCGIADEEGPVANAIAFALTDMSPMDLISVFRSKQGCLSHSKDVARGVIDGVVAAFRSQTTPNSMLGNFLQNMLSQTLYERGFFTKIGNAVCNVAYKGKSSQLPKLGEKSTSNDNDPRWNNKTPGAKDKFYKPNTSTETSPL